MPNRCISASMIATALLAGGICSDTKAQQVTRHRGVNIVAADLVYGDGFNSPREVVNKMKRLGITLIRMDAFFGFDPFFITDDAAVRARIDAYVRPGGSFEFDMIVALTDEIRAQGAGIKIIVDMHNCPNDQWGDDYHIVFSDDMIFRAKAQGWMAYAWRQIAQRFKGNPNILGFDLLNEPKTTDQRAWSALANRLISDIRAIDPDRIIYIEPLRGASRYLGDLRRSGILSNRNMRVSLNVYATQEYTHQGIYNKPFKAYDESVRRALRDEVDAIVRFRESTNTPILIGEFCASIYAPRTELYFAKSIELYEEAGFDWAFLSFRSPREPWSPFNHEGLNPTSWRVITEAWKRR